jgi:hypothetical protein
MHSDLHDGHENLEEAVSDSMGLDEVTEERNDSPPAHDELPEAAKKRLGMQEKRHKKEMKRVQQQLDEMRRHVMSGSQTNQQDNDMDQSFSPDGGLTNQSVYQAVAQAMQAEKAKEEQARKQAEAQAKMQHVQKAYQSLEEQLENGSDEYEDFDEVVKSNDAPYTDMMRDASLLIDNPKDVLYHLGKDREKLKRISELEPLDQMKEVIKLSMALSSGNAPKQSGSNPKLLDGVKNKPTSNAGVNENTSVSEIRQRMKNGGKKWA